MEKSKLNYILAFITLIMGYLFQCAASDKLIFFSEIVTKSAQKKVFDNSFIILIILGFFYVLLFLIINNRSHNKIITNTCNQICEYIFRYIEKKLPSDYMKNVRVTIFKATYNKNESSYLSYLSRYQIRAPYKSSRLKFNPGSGCAGMCFQTQSVIHESVREYNSDKPEVYYKSMKSKFNLSKHDVDILNIKACSFLGLPIKCHKNNLTWGVIVIDSLKPHNDLKNIARELENVVGHYTPFFTEVGK